MQRCLLRMCVIVCARCWRAIECMRMWVKNAYTVMRTYLLIITISIVLYVIIAMIINSVLGNLENYSGTCMVNIGLYFLSRLHNIRCLYITNKLSTICKSYDVVYLRHIHILIVTNNRYQAVYADYYRSILHR